MDKDSIGYLSIFRTRIWNREEKNNTKWIQMHNVHIVSFSAYMDSDN
jgi:hypothetical protein